MRRNFPWEFLEISRLTLQEFAQTENELPFKSLPPFLVNFKSDDVYVLHSMPPFAHSLLRIHSLVSSRQYLELHIVRRLRSMVEGGTEAVRRGSGTRRQSTAPRQSSETNFPNNSNGASNGALETRTARLTARNAAATSSVDATASTKAITSARNSRARTCRHGEDRDENCRTTR